MSSPRSLFSKTVSKKPRIDNEEKQDHTTSQGTGRNNSSTSVRKPAFNPALLSSAFYTGPTMYGGAGACSSSPYFNQYTKSKFYDRKKTDIKVTPSTPDNSMSQTSRRILDLLEQYSSPISDAKRVPVNNKPSVSAHKKVLNSSIFDLSKKSFHDDSPTQHSCKSNRFRDLQIPSMATLMKIKRNTRSGNNTHAAILASMSSSLPYKPAEYSLRSDTSTYKNKIKSKLGSRSNKIDEEDFAQPVNLPNISLNMTGLPTFTIEPFKPQLSSSKYSVTERKEAVPAASASVVPNFKFTSPVAVGNTDGARAITKFHFSEPLDIFSPKFSSTMACDETDSSNKRKHEESAKSLKENRNTFNSRLTCVDSDSGMPKSKPEFSQPIQNFKAGDSDLTPKMTNKRPIGMWNGKDWKNKETEKSPLLNGDIKSSDLFSKKPFNSLKSDINKEQLNSDSENTKKVKSDTVISTTPGASLDTFVKKQQQQWECSTCMTRNEQSKMKCVCCETPKPGAPASAPAPAPATVLSNTGFSGMGSFIKKQQEQWECSCCMTRNDQNRIKCVCCEASKPGCELPPAAAVKFNFGNTQNTFKFGIDKADEPIKPSINEVKSPEKSLLPTTGFIFGNSTTVTDVKPGNGSIGGFKFGVTNGNTAKPAEVSSLPNPSTLFGEKKESLPVVSTGGFTFGVKKTEDPTTTGTTSSTETKTSTFTFSSQKTESASELEKPKSGFGTQPESSKTNTTSFITKSSDTPAVPTTSISTVTTTSAINPPAFSFGVPQSSSKPTFGNNTLFQFGTSASTTPATTAADSSFKPAGSFTFGSKNTQAASTDTKSTTETGSKPNFQLPTTNTASLFPATNAVTSQAKENEKSSTPIGSSIQFPSNPLIEKPKDQPTSPFFGFGSSSSSVSNAGNTFKSPTSSVPVFSFGSASTTKPETTTLFNAPVVNSLTGGLFGSKPSSDQSISAPSTSLFKPTPSTTPSSFTSPSTNIFGSAQSAPSQMPSSGVFGSGSLNLTTAKPSVPIFGSAPIPDATSQSPQTNSLFSNPSVPSFNSGNIFGSNAQPNSVPTQPAPMFGNPMNKPTTEPGSGMFMSNAPPPAATGNIFGSAMPAAAPAQSSSGIFGSSPSVPTPVFGASIPFGEASQNQNQQSVPFKFGASSSTQPPGVGFGQAPAAGSSAPVFSFGSGAPPPPPTNSQFNFSMGAPSSAFTSTPGTMANPAQRRIKKAVRRNVLR